MNIRRGNLTISYEGGLDLSQLAELPETFRGAGLPTDARIVYLGLNQSYSGNTVSSDLSVGWEMPA